MGGIIVVPALMGRLCNRVLQCYRAFWFAAVHGLPPSSVRIPCDGIISGSRLFDGMRGSIVPGRDLDSVTPVVTYNCRGRLTQEVRKDLFDMPIPDSGCVRIVAGSFLYPELPWERALFAGLFDNRKFRDEVVSRYASLLCGNTVGYTVRRGDTVDRRKYRTLSPEFIVSDWEAIVARYHGLVRIVVTSDDCDYVERLVSANSRLADNVAIVRDDPDACIYLLSMCDTVVNNGQLQCVSAWTNEPETLYESTFGQVAQALNRSYKYAAFRTSGPGATPATDPSGLSATRGGCECRYPPLINPD